MHRLTLPANAICRARKKSGLTLTRLAELSSVCSTSIGRLECCQGNPGFATLLHLADALDLTLVELVVPQDLTLPQRLALRVLRKATQNYV